MDQPNMNEEWRPVVGCEDWYEVSNLGRIRRRSIISPSRNKHGYMVAGLSCGGVKLWKSVHCMVAEAFSGKRPPGKVARHKDGDRTNNAANNLEWGTQAENMGDMVRHGTRRNGEKHHKAKLSEPQVLSIRDMHSRGMKKSGIAVLFGVTPSLVGGIVKRKIWRHV